MMRYNNARKILQAFFKISTEEEINKRRKLIISETQYISDLYSASGVTYSEVKSGRISDPTYNKVMEIGKERIKVEETVTELLQEIYEIKKLKDIMNKYFSKLSITQMSIIELSYCNETIEGEKIRTVSDIARQLDLAVSTVNNARCDMIKEIDKFKINFDLVMSRR